MDKIDKVIKYFRNLKENVSIPTNNISQGNIAGTSAAGDDPPVFSKRKKRYIYGPRKVWLDYLKNK